MKLFATYRKKTYEAPVNVGGRLILNGSYTPSFVMSGGTFADYTEAGLTKILDMEIPEERYVAETAPGIKKLTRFLVCEYDDSVDAVELAASLERTGGEFWIKVLTIEEASNWLRSNTDLEETEKWLFMISGQQVNELTHTEVPAKYLDLRILQVQF